MKKLGTYILVAALAGPGAATADSQLRADTTFFDFGKVAPQARLIHSFRLVSSGSDSLGINEFKTGCGCLSARTIDSLIRPSDSTRIVLTWETPPDSQRVSQAAFLFTDASIDPVRFSLAADCRLQQGSTSDPVAISPIKLSFGQPGSGTTRSAAITLRNNLSHVAALKLVAVYPGNLTVRLPDSLPAEGVDAMIVAIPDEVPIPVSVGSVTFEVKSGLHDNYRATIELEFSPRQKKSLVSTRVE